MSLVSRTINKSRASALGLFILYQEKNGRLQRWCVPQPYLGSNRSFAPVRGTSYPTGVEDICDDDAASRRRGFHIRPKYVRRWTGAYRMRPYGVYIVLNTTKLQPPPLTNLRNFGIIYSYPNLTLQGENTYEQKRHSSCRNHNSR